MSINKYNESGHIIPAAQADLPFTPSDPDQWGGDVDTVPEALDELGSQTVIYTSGIITLGNGIDTFISHPDFEYNVDITGVKRTTGNPADILLHFDGSDGSSTIVESGTGNATWSSSGASISTAQAKFDQSLLINPSTDYVRSNVTTTTRGSGQSWTVDCWARPSSSSGLFRCFLDSAGDWQWLASGGNWYFAPNGTGINTGVAASANTWYHLEACCDGSTLYLFVDGVLRHSQAYASSLGGSSRQWGVGNFPGLTSDITGNVDEVRLIWGTCAHTTGFTPPSAPYPNPGVTKTALILGTDYTAATGPGGTTIRNISGSSMSCRYDVKGWQ